MRFFAVVLTLLATTTSAWALRCAAPPAEFWPAGGETIPEAPKLVVVSNGSNVLEKAWLEGPEKVELVIETHPKFQILKPQKSLQAGQSYTLKGFGTGQFSAGEKQVPVTWKVAKTRYSPATWNAPVKLGEGRADGGRWGTTSHQDMTLDYAHTGPVIAEVVMSRGDESRTFMMAAAKSFRIGRDLCGGQLRLEGEGEWTARISLVAPDGTRSAVQTVKFPSPAKPKSMFR